MHGAQNGVKDFGGLMNAWQDTRAAALDPGTAAMLQGFNGFGGQIGGAMGQMASINSANQQVAMDARRRAEEMAFQERMSNTEREDKQKKFGMLFKALLGDVQDKPRANGEMSYNMTMSPLIKMMMGNSQQFGGNGMPAANNGIYPIARMF
jgi:hypothetical protein